MSHISSIRQTIVLTGKYYSNLTIKENRND